MGALLADAGAELIRYSDEVCCGCSGSMKVCQQGIHIEVCQQGIHIEVCQQGIQTMWQEGIQTVPICWKDAPSAVCAFSDVVYEAIR